MSWYVEFLLLNREVIRSSIYEDNSIKDFIDMPPGELIDEDIDIDSVVPLLKLDDDTYNDLLDVERVYNKLYTDKLLHNSEIESLKYLLISKTLRNASKESGLSRITITNNFRTLCNKIAYSLGGYFTNDGYIEYLVDKYNLNNEQIKKLERYIFRGVKLDND